MTSVSESSQAPTATNIVGAGLSLGSERPYAAYCIGSSERQTTTAVDFGDDLIPPSVLLPRLHGEPPRLEFRWPGHPRGSGGPWPPEASVTPEAGAGRFPLAYAWAMLANQVSQARWHWCRDGREQLLEPAEAIGKAAATIISLVTNLNSAGDPVMIMPNHCTGAAQQKLLDSVRRYGARIRLLWRPVAAAMAWCDHCRDDLIRMTEGGADADHGLEADVVFQTPEGQGQGQRLGKLVSLHMGLECIEVTVLEIVRVSDSSGHMHFIPARGRPVGEPLPSMGITAMEQLANHFAVESLDTKATGAAWRLLWSMPWLPLALQILRGSNGQRRLPGWVEDRGLPPDTAERILGIWPTAHDELATQRSSPFEDIRKKVPAFPRINRIQDWINSTMTALREHEGSVLGAVVTGPMATVLYKDKPLGEAWLKKIGLCCDRLLSEGRELESGVLARMAAVHSARLKQGLPTYLDTLPRVRLVVTKLGEPVWENLLQDTEKYVDGGGRYSRKGVGAGQMVIGRKETSLAIDLHHEEHPTVRTYDVPLPKVPERDIPIALDVSITPAQGNALVEVVPEDGEFLEGRAVQVNWQRNMTESGKSPDEYLDALDRILPPTFPRHSSKLFWSGGIDDMGHDIDGAAKSIRAYLPHGTEDMLKYGVIVALRTKDRQRGLGEYTAVSSEGTPGSDSADDNKLLKQFVRMLTGRLDKPSSTKIDNVVRALAYTSTRDPSFAAYLAQRVNRVHIHLKQYDLVACGWCLRDLEVIGDFADVLLKRCQWKLDETNNWLKAFWEILRYREEATREIASKTCIQITECLLDIFEQEHGKKNFKFKFRYASGCIAYLLRRRMYDPAYLDPEGAQGKAIKLAFQNAMKEVARHPENGIGGFVQIDKQLGLIIDYIDRHGHGPILIGLEDT